MERKKLLFLIVSILVALSFISSYVSLTNYNGQSGGTTSVPQTIFGQGITTGTIIGYGTPLSITVSCSNSLDTNNTISNLSSALTSMENNNSISNLYNSGGNFQVAPGGLNSYQIYQHFNRTQNSTTFKCLNFTAPAIILLPTNITMAVGNQQANLPINESNRNVSIILSLSNGIGTKLHLKMSSLITVNGTFYGPKTVSLIQ